MQIAILGVIVTVILIVWLLCHYPASIWRQCGICPNWFDQYRQTWPVKPKGKCLPGRNNICPDCANRSRRNFLQIQRLHLEP